MSPTVLAIGLLVAFIGVVWAAMLLWGLICPPVASVPEHRREQCPRSSRLSAPPVASRRGDARFPVVMMPEAPVVAAVALPDDEKVVSLSEWRERRERTG